MEHSRTIRGKHDYLSTFTQGRPRGRKSGSPSRISQNSSNPPGPTGRGSAGKDHGEQIEYIEVILEGLDKLVPSLDEETNEEASKTQGTLPGALKASPTEEAAVEPATSAGRDKEGAQPSSMASTG